MKNSVSKDFHTFSHIGRLATHNLEFNFPTKYFHYNFLNSFIRRFDCGSGVGVVRSEETVILNQWNRITLYRHRWDAWLQLNSGKHIKGRSKVPHHYTLSTKYYFIFFQGLFSRITFREPLFIGGAGNTTGLSEKLPVAAGLRGCIRHLEINDHSYNFALEPSGDASKGFGIRKHIGLKTRNER